MRRGTRSIVRPILLVVALAACGGAASGETGGGEVGQEAGAAAPSAHLEKVTFTVPSMSCPLCSRPIEARLEEAGLRDVDIDLDAKLVAVRFDPERMSVDDIRSLVEGQGFPVTETKVGEG